MNKFKNLVVGFHNKITIIKNNVIQWSLMMNEENYMNSLNKNIHNILYLMKNNGIIIYYKSNNILINIIKNHLNMILINKYHN